MGCAGLTIFLVGLRNRFGEIIGMVPLLSPAVLWEESRVVLYWEYAWDLFLETLVEFLDISVNVLLIGVFVN